MDDSHLFIKQSVTYGFNPKAIHGPIAPIYPSWMSDLGNASNYTCSATMSWVPTKPWTDYPGVKEWIDLYHKNVGDGVHPQCMDAACYGDCQVTEQAVTAVGSTDQEALRQYISSHKFDTVYGRVDFQAAPYQFMNLTGGKYLFQVQDKELRLIWPADVAQAQGVYPKPPW